MESNKSLTCRNVAKYFGHGIIFSILFFILTIAWAFVFVVLVFIGWIIGLIVGLGLLILIIGFVNAVVTSFLWFPVKMSFWSLLGHGFALFLILLIPDIVIVAIPTYFFPGIATIVGTRIVISFLYGFVGKKVAGFWEETVPERVPASVEAKWRDKNL